jgi:hypothetical protein
MVGLLSRRVFDYIYTTSYLKIDFKYPGSATSTLHQKPKSRRKGTTSMGNWYKISYLYKD